MESISHQKEKEIASKLLKMRTKTEVSSFLEEIFKNSEGNFKWVPVGGKLDNARSIELTTEQAPPLVERITNSIDALIELCEADIPEDQPRPQSPREAAERWFSVPKGHLENLSNEKIQELASNIKVEICESENQHAPTILIVDKGIGQHPLDFDKTIVSLGESIKWGKHFLCGAYGQGGSSTLWWCEYTIIISHRRSKHNRGRTDLVGWTIVRKNRENLEYKTTVYEYLVNNDGSVPTLSPLALEELGFEFGTYVAHIQYDLGREYSGPASLVSYRLFHGLLFDPILPFWLEDTRQFKNISKFRRTISGNAARLKDNPNVLYSNEHVADLGPDGKFVIRYWVMKIKPHEEEGEERYYQWSYLDKEKSSRIVAIVLNGQRHDSIDKDFIKQTTQLSFLTEYIIVEAECDALSLRLKREIFAAHRGRIREGEGRLDLIRNRVAEALKTDDKLQELESHLREQYLTHMDEASEKRVRKLLDRLITVTQDAESPGGGVQSGTGPGREGEQEFKPNDPPTLLHFLLDEELLEIPQDRYRELTLETDGPDDLLTRDQNKAQFVFSLSQNSGIGIEPGSFRNCQMRIRISAAPTVPVGTNDELTCTLDMPQLKIPLKASQKLHVVEPPAPYSPNDPPTILRIVNKEPIPLQQGTKSIIRIQMDGPDNLLTRPLQAAQFEKYCSIPGSSIPDQKGPRNGELQIFVFVPETVSKGTQGTVECTLRLADGTVMETRKNCTVVEKKPPPPPTTLHGTRRKQRVPNYDLNPVYQKDWWKYGWNEKNVGSSEKSQGKLILSVNLDHEELTKDLSRREKANEGSNQIDRIKRKYFAHIGYHLWLWHKYYRENHPQIPRGLDLKEIEDEELRRVAKTVILLMRPERGLE
jgi:hypothetical protein